MMCGFVPYGEDLADPFDIYEEIVGSQQLEYPEFMDEDPLAIHCINQMLGMRPETRLGGSGFASLKAHPWFDEAGFDWVSKTPVKARFI